MARTGAQIVGTSAARLVAFSLPLSSGILLKADGNNTQPIDVGFSSTLTAGTSGDDGFPLKAGESHTVPLAQASNGFNIWLIAGGANQRIYWSADIGPTNTGWAMSFFQAHCSGYLAWVG
jgi:hypothetical protein